MAGFKEANKELKQEKEELEKDSFSAEMDNHANTEVSFIL